MKPEEFIHSLEDGVPDIVVCTGEERFFMEEVLAAVETAMTRADPGFNQTRFDPPPAESPGAQVQRLLRELSTQGLFGGKTLFLVRNGDDILKALVKELGDFLNKGRSLPHRLLLFVSSLDGRTKFAKRVKAGGGLVECRKLYASSAFWQRGAEETTELVRWTVGRARSRGLDLGPQAASFLTALTGNDLFRIDAELEKLRLSMPEGRAKVEVDAIERLTGMSAVHTPFDLWDKIEAGDRAGALDTLCVIFRNGLRSVSGKLETDPAAIAAILLGMFRDRTRLSAQVALLQWERKTDQAIREQLKISSVFYFNKLKATAGRLTADRLKVLNESLLAAERRIKRQGYLGVPVMEEAVISMAGAGS